MLGFSAPVLYAIHLVHQELTQNVSVIENHALFYIVTAFVTWPFADDSSEIPFVRVGKGINLAIVAIIALYLVLGVLSMILFFLLLIYFY